MISVLKLDRGPQVNVTYAKNFTSEEPYKLLEVDEAILQELLENGLTIKGAPNDEAVLCTSTATYAMKFVSTSNTVLLVCPPSGPSQSADNIWETEGESEPEIGVVATASGHIEVVETAPRLEKLRALVSQRPFRDDDMNVDDEEGCAAGQLYTWEELSACFQASDKQLREELKKLEAVEIGKYWRVVDPVYMKNLLEILVATAVQHEWPVKALKGSEVIRRLEADSFPPQVVLSCLNKFGIRTDHGLIGHDIAASGKQSTTNSGTETWALDELKICVHYARILFTFKPIWKMQIFMDEWNLITPPWITPHFNMLGGEALVEQVGVDSWLHQLCSSFLPVNLDARFKTLFNLKPKWELKDLEPYLRDLNVPGLSVEAILLKYTRKSHPTPLSTPYYTAR